MVIPPRAVSPPQHLELGAAFQLTNWRNGEVKMKAKMNLKTKQQAGELQERSGKAQQQAELVK